MHQMKNSNNSKAIFISECLIAKIWRIILLGCQVFEPIKLLDFGSFFFWDYRHWGNNGKLAFLDIFTANFKKNLNFKVFVLHSEFKIARIVSPYIPSYVSLWSINNFLIQKNKAFIRRNQCWDKFRLTVCEIRLTVPFYLWIFFILPHYLNITH